MAKTTVAQLEERFNIMQADMAKLVQAVSTMAAQTVQAPQPEKKVEKPKKPWLAACPDYATPAQKLEYDKLAKRAAEQRDAVKAALGTEAVSAFIPVPKTAGRMPHTIKWSATYN